MRLELFPNGLVDDMAGDANAVVLRRTGDARYSLTVAAGPKIEVELWTARKNRMRALFWDDRPAWVSLAADADEELESLSAEQCAVHLENLDRASYFLGLARGADHWGLTLRARGYIKARIVPGGEMAG